MSESEQPQDDNGDNGDNGGAGDYHGDDRSLDALLEERVERLMSYRDELLPVLTAFAAELSPSRYRRDLLSLIGELERGASPKSLVQSDRMVAILTPLLGPASRPAVASQALRDLLSEAASLEELHLQRTRVLIYPLVVFAIAILVLVFLCTTVTPVYSDIFRSFGLSLPTATVAIVAVSDWIISAPYAAAAAFVGLCIAAYGSVRCFHRINTTGWFDAAFATLTRGTSRELLATASFAHRLSEGLAAQLSLPNSLELAARTIDHYPLASAARQVADDLTSGAPRFSASPAARRFPATLLAAFHSADPASPAGARLLDAFADACLERVRRRMDWSMGFAGPFAIATVGIVVGLVLIAMMLPLISLVNGLSG